MSKEKEISKFLAELVLIQAMKPRDKTTLLKLMEEYAKEQYKKGYNNAASKKDSAKETRGDSPHWDGFVMNSWD